MTDDLRVLAEVFSENGCAMPSDVERLAKGYLSLLTSLEAREVEHRMLKQSNTVLNERLEEAERDKAIAEQVASAIHSHCEPRLEAVERERDVVLERFAERTADWNTTLERAEKAEAALGTLLASIRAQRLGAHFGASLDWAYAALEGREEKPSGESPG